MAVGMGEWAELASAVVGATAGYVAAKQTASATATVAKAETSIAASNARIAEAQALQAREALVASQGFPGASAPAGYATGGTPGWVAPAAIGAGVLVVGGLIYAMTRR
jgi:hypothetical protein